MPPKRVTTSDGLFAIPSLPKKTRAARSSRSSSRESVVSLNFSVSSSRSQRSRTPSVDPYSNHMREVPEDSFEYGFNNRGAENSHLIVLEPTHRHLARVYAFHNNKYWKCMKCLKISAKKTTRAVFVDGKLRVPIATQHRCVAEKLEDVRKLHNSFAEKFGNLSLTNGQESDQEDSEMEAAPRNNNVNIIFNHPSSEWIRKKCDLLGLKYFVSAYQLWAQCDIDIIKPTSVPDETLDELTNTDYGCISKFFTGDVTSTNKVSKAINKYFLGNFKSLRKFGGKNFAKVKSNDKWIQELVFSDEMSNFHFELLARWFECRIGIFEDNEWKRFGKWSVSNKETITMLIQKEDQEYKIILTLK